MTDQVPPPANGTDIRLDVLIQRVERLCDILTPAVEPEPADGETVELREPEPPKRVRKRT
jgi:hypothetical protein